MLAVGQLNANAISKVWGLFCFGGQLTTLLDNKINSLFCQASSQQENFDRPLANKRINNEFFYANGQLKI